MMRGFLYSRFWSRYTTCILVSQRANFEKKNSCTFDEQFTVGGAKIIYDRVRRTPKKSRNFLLLEADRKLAAVAAVFEQRARCQNIASCGYIWITDRTSNTTHTNVIVGGNFVYHLISKTTVKIQNIVVQYLKKIKFQMYISSKWKNGGKLCHQRWTSILENNDAYWNTLVNSAEYW